MKCQVCGTVDNKDGRGPVIVDSSVDEGLCTPCSLWFTDLRVTQAIRFFSRGGK